MVVKLNRMVIEQWFDELWTTTIGLVPKLFLNVNPVNTKTVIRYIGILAVYLIHYCNSFNHNIQQVVTKLKVLAFVSQYKE